MTIPILPHNIPTCRILDEQSIVECLNTYDSRPPSVNCGDGVRHVRYRVSPVSPSPSWAFFSNSIFPKRNVMPAAT